MEERVIIKVSVLTDQKKLDKAVKLINRANKLLSKVYKMNVEDGSINTSTGN